MLRDELSAAGHDCIGASHTRNGTNIELAKPAREILTSWKFDDLQPAEFG